MAGPAHNRLVVIAFSGVDWPGLVARLHARRLPQLAALIGRGAALPLITPPPMRAPTGWATIASGQLPEAHGVISADEGWAGGLRPASRASWRRAAVWDRLAAAGIPTAGVGWPASGPGEQVPGLHVDDSFGRLHGRDWNDWALPPHCVPAAHREALRELRVHSSELEPHSLLPLVPALPQLDAEAQGHLPELAGAMARAASEQAAMMWLLTRPDWRAAFVHHEWLAAIRRSFEGAADPYAGAVEGAWRFLDALAGALVQAAEDATVLLVSTGWQHDPGVLIAAGQGIRRPDRPNAHALDLAPTVLAHFGLQAADLPGQRLGWLDAPETLAPCADAASTPPEIDSALLTEVVDAGFAPPPGSPPLHRALVLGELAEAMVARNAEGARSVALQALALDPGSLPAMRALGSAAIALGDVDALGTIADTLDAHVPGSPWTSLARAAWHVLRGESALAAPLLREAEAAEDIETLLRVGAGWQMVGRAQEARRLFERVLGIAPGLAAAELGLSMAMLAGRDFLGAELPLRRLLEREPGHAGAYRLYAQVYAAQGRTADAEQANAAAEALGG